MEIIFSMAGYTKLVGIPGTIEYFAKLGFPLPVVTAWFITRFFYLAMERLS
jgi:uncharacterized membrane protein YphA (DoxX/SURF4 family)